VSNHHIETLQIEKMIITSHNQPFPQRNLYGIFWSFFATHQNLDGFLKDPQGHYLDQERRPLVLQYGHRAL